MGVLYARVGGAWVPISGGGTVSGPEASKPTTPSAPMEYFATDTKRKWMWDGTGWIVVYEPFQAFVPSLSGWVLGIGGTSTGVYQRSMTWCSFECTMTLGSSGFTVGGGTFTLPRTALTLRTNQLQISFIDVGGWRYNGQNDPGTTSCPISALNTTATYSHNAGAIGPTVPFGWGAGDSVEISGRYRISAYT